MPAAATLESINVEQLATATDRLLLRAQFSDARPSTRLRSSSPSFARGSHIVLDAPAVQPPVSTDLWQRFTTVALVTALCAVTAAIVVVL